MRPSTNSQQFVLESNPDEINNLLDDNDIQIVLYHYFMNFYKASYRGIFVFLPCENKFSILNKVPRIQLQGKENTNTTNKRKPMQVNHQHLS